MPSKKNETEIKAYKITGNDGMILKTDKMNFDGVIKNIPTLPSKNVDTVRSAQIFANEVGYPVAIKIRSDDITHKTDAGGVKLNIINDLDVEYVMEKMFESISKNYPQCRLDGFTIQKMAPPDGIEMICGIKKDPQFGHVIMFGLGGIYAEVFNDIVFKVVPFCEYTAFRMIGEIDSNIILNGFRGSKPVDLQSIVGVIMELQKICIEHPEIEELDINPLMCYHNGCLVIDGRVF